jgi:hypothetical protein
MELKMNLSETIQSLTKDIIHLSMDCTRRLAQVYTSNSKNTISNEDYGTIILEFQYLFIHVIDRAACMLLPEEECDIFMEALRLSIVSANIGKSLKGMDEKSKKDAESHEINLLNLRNTEYAAYKKLSPDDNEGTKGTLLWEFGKKITFDNLHSNNPAIIVQCSLLASEVFTEIDIEKTINHITFYPQSSSN